MILLRLLKVKHQGTSLVVQKLSLQASNGKIEYYLHTQIYSHTCIHIHIIHRQVMLLLNHCSSNISKILGIIYAAICTPTEDPIQVSNIWGIDKNVFPMNTESLYSWYLRIIRHLLPMLFTSEKFTLLSGQYMSLTTNYFERKNLL